MTTHDTNDTAQAVIEAARQSWRQIDTSTDEGRRALDIEIARRLGYTVRHSRQTNTYALVRPSGYLHMANVVLNFPSVANWTFKDVSDLFERHTEHEAWSDCEYYTTDLNAALALPLPTACDISITHHPQAFDQDKRHSAIVRWYVPRADGTHELRDYAEWGTSPALVASRVWLSWHDAKSDILSSDTE